MTEENAKTKWCPILGLGGAILNIQEGQRECIGSACMMWRQTDLIQERRDSPDHAEKQLWKQQIGYCGLAGKP